MLDHANLDAMCSGVIDAFKMTGADHSLLILPLFHVNGIVVGTLSPLLAGGSDDRRGPVQPEDVLRPDRAEPARRTSPPFRPSTRCSPTCPPSVQPDTSSVRFAICGAAPASVELLDGSKPATASRSSRATGCPRDPAPAPSIPLDGTAQARHGRDFPCPARRSASSTTAGRAVPDGEAGEGPDRRAPT